MECPLFLRERGRLRTGKTQFGNKNRKTEVKTKGRKATRKGAEAEL